MSRVLARSTEDSHQAEAHHTADYSFWEGAELLHRSSVVEERPRWQRTNTLVQRLVRMDAGAMNHDMGFVKDRHGLEVLSVQECWSLLDQSEIGRVAFVDAGEPVILPVTYRLDRHSIVFRSSEGSKLSAASMGAVVGFEVDHYDPAVRCGWSVVTRGVAERLYDEDDIAQSGADLLTPWVTSESPTHPVRVRVWELSGRRIVPVSGPRPAGPEA